MTLPRPSAPPSRAPLAQARDALARLRREAGDDVFRTEQEAFANTMDGFERFLAGVPALPQRSVDAFAQIVANAITGYASRHLARLLDDTHEEAAALVARSGHDSSGFDAAAATLRAVAVLNAACDAAADQLAGVLRDVETNPVFRCLMPATLQSSFPALRAALAAAGAGPSEHVLVQTEAAAVAQVERAIVEGLGQLQQVSGLRRFFSGDAGFLAFGTEGVRRAERIVPALDSLVALLDPMALAVAALVQAAEATITQRLEQAASASGDTPAVRRRLQALRSAIDLARGRFPALASPDAAARVRVLFVDGGTLGPLVDMLVEASGMLAAPAHRAQRAAAASEG